MSHEIWIKIEPQKKNTLYRKIESSYDRNLDGEENSNKAKMELAKPQMVKCSYSFALCGDSFPLLITGYCHIHCIPQVFAVCGREAMYLITFIVAFCHFEDTMFGNNFIRWTDYSILLTYLLEFIIDIAFFIMNKKLHFVL